MASDKTSALPELSADMAATPYYCEYYYCEGTWRTVASNAPLGYYCPAEPNSKPLEGATGCCEAVAFADTPPAQSLVAPSLPQRPVCEYEFRDGKFYLRAANCPAGSFCPPDPVQVVREQGEANLKWASVEGHIVVTMPPVELEYLPGPTEANSYAGDPVA